jgi:hypothetical protein
MPCEPPAVSRVKHPRSGEIRSFRTGVVAKEMTASGNLLGTWRAKRGEKDATAQVIAALSAASSLAQGSLG